MDLVLLESIARSRIVARARVMRHRQIPAIPHSAAIPKLAPEAPRRLAGVAAASASPPLLAGSAVVSGPTTTCGAPAAFAT